MTLGYLLPYLAFNLENFLSLAAVYLTLTLVVECLVAAAFGLRSKRQVGAVVCVNLITQPLAFALWAALILLMPLLSADTSWPVMLVLESAIVYIEWRLLTWSLKGQPRATFTVALSMNAVSFLFGATAFNLYVLG